MMKTKSTLMSMGKWAMMFLFAIVGSGILAQGVPEYMYFKFDAAGNQQNYASAPVGTNPAILTGLTIGGTGQFSTALVGNYTANNYLNTGWATNLPSTGWTISLWLNNISNGNTSPNYLFGDVNANSFRCFSDGAALPNNLMLRGGGLTDLTVTGIAPGPMVVTFVYTGTSIKYFKNGVLAGTAAQPTVTITGTGPFTIGAYSTSAGMPIGGLMDEFRMYNRALSDAEVGNTWNQPLPLGGPPVVVTTAATSVTGNSASLNGTVNANGYSTTVTFDYGLTTAYGTTVSGVPGTVTGSSVTPVAAAITGLTNNTTYHYRVNGVNSSGTTNGNDMTFTTLGPPPVVVTTAATAVAANTATLNGTVNANNASTTVTFDYGLTTAYGTTVAGVPPTVTGNSVTPSSAAIAGLTANTLYHYRINGTSANGTSNGNDMTFTTTGPPPTVVTLAATAVTGTTATLNGTVNANNVLSTVSFEYGLTAAYGTIVSGVPATVSGNVVTAVNAPLTGLLPGNTYHFRVTATNSNGTSNGNDLTFNTPALAPTVITYAATAINTTIATLNGLVTANGSSTTVWFDYGLTIAYGTTVAATPPTVTGNVATQVSANLTGLTNGATYHYRVRGVNAIGTTNGNDVSFVTGCFAAGPAGPITGTGQVCQGGSGYVYAVAPIANASGYIWTVPVGGSITAGANTNSITVSYSPTAVSGYVYVYAVAACGNGSPAQLAVAMNAPATPALSGPASTCLNVAGNVYTTQASMSNYVWTVSSGGSITGGGTSSSNTVTITWLTTGAKTVSVNYNNAAGCPGLAPAVYNVTVNTLPAPTITGPSPSCSNFPGIVYSTQAGMTGYTWNISAGGQITGGTGTNSITVTWNATGAQNVSVNYTNAGGCTAPAAVVYPVTVNASPVPTIAGSTNLCVNSGYYNYTTEAGMTGYSWTVSPGGTITYGGGTNTVQVIWPNVGSQWVRVNYNNASGCQAVNPTQLNVTVNGYPGATGSITGSPTVCAGATGIAYSVAPVTNAVAYVWTLPAGATIATGANTNSITVNFAANATSGNITASANNICGNGTVSPLFAVTVNALPDTPGTITGPASVCQGATGLVYSVPTIAGATGYLWSIPDAATITSGANTSSITVNFSPTALSGTFSVRGTNSCGNGPVSANFPVTVNPIPATPVVTNTGYTVYSSAATGNQWYYSATAGGTGAPISGATAQSYDCTLTGTGYYWSIVTLNGCISAESNHQYVIVTGIGTHPSSSINVYPVPNDGRFTISFSTSSRETYNIRVFNSLGVNIFEELKLEVNGSLEKVIDLRPVPNGVYSVIFENNLGQVVKKIVVNK
jgi:phosphodiesterase/alkaline phosphatase D-like protein